MGTVAVSIAHIGKRKACKQPDGRLKFTGFQTALYSFLMEDLPELWYS